MANHVAVLELLFNYCAHPFYSDILLLCSHSILPANVCLLLLNSVLPGSPMSGGCPG